MTMRTHDIDDMVREADPVTAGDAEAWMGSPATSALRARISTGTKRAEPSLGLVGHRSRVRVLVFAAVALVLIGAAAAAATILLGEPAPPAVKRDIAGVDEGFPADLRLNPDVANARSVASAGTSVLYFAELKDGGHCTELVTSGLPRGAVCHTAQQVESMPVEVTIPFTNPVTDGSPVILGGRANAEGARSLEIRYSDGSDDLIALGTDGFFVFEIPSAHLAAIHGSDFELVALAQDGKELASLVVPAIGEEPAGPLEDPAPITVDTISDGSDLTLVLGVRGRVNDEGAVSLEFRYPDGTIVSVPLQDDGSYDFDIPTARQGDLLHAPATLIARGADGQEVASVPVASVAFWRIHGG